MADEEFTPGPWQWEGNSLVSNAPGLNYGSRYVIEVHDGTIYSEYSADGASLDCAIENARLIQEAPTLYAALKPFADIDGEDDDDYPDDTKVTLTFGRSTHYALTLGDLRRARKAVDAADGYGPDKVQSND